MGGAQQWRNRGQGRELTEQEYREDRISGAACRWNSGYVGTNVEHQDRELAKHGDREQTDIEYCQQMDRSDTDQENSGNNEQTELEDREQREIEVSDQTENDDSGQTEYEDRERVRCVNDDSNETESENEEKTDSEYYQQTEQSDTEKENDGNNELTGLKNTVQECLRSVIRRKMTTVARREYEDRERVRCENDDSDETELENRVLERETTAKTGRNSKFYIFADDVMNKVMD